jgi:hypothetical protein
MSIAHATRALTTALLIGLGATGLSACGDDGNDGRTPAKSQENELIRFRGAVTEIDDKIPVDGGVTIRMTDEAKGAVTIGFESLFTLPRPTEDRQALYGDIQKVTVGDVVSATARMVDGGYRLESISVIEDH